MVGASGRAPKTYLSCLTPSHTTNAGRRAVPSPFRASPRSLLVLGHPRATLLHSHSCSSCGGPVSTSRRISHRMKGLVFPLHES